MQENGIVDAKSITTMRRQWHFFTREIFIDLLFVASQIVRTHWAISIWRNRSFERIERARDARNGIHSYSDAIEMVGIIEINFFLLYVCIKKVNHWRLAVFHSESWESTKSIKAFVLLGDLYIFNRSSLLFAAWLCAFRTIHLFTQAYSHTKSVPASSRTVDYIVCWIRWLLRGETNSTRQSRSAHKKEKTEYETKMLGLEFHSARRSAMHGAPPNRMCGNAIRR